MHTHMYKCMRYIGVLLATYMCVCINIYIYICMYEERDRERERERDRYIYAHKLILVICFRFLSKYNSRFFQLTASR